MKTKHQALILLVGICICAICALDPPRKMANPSDNRFLLEGGNITPEIEVPHAFLFSADFGIFTSSSRTGANPDGHLMHYKVEIDGGRLLAELALIASATGISVLLPKVIRHDA